MPITAPNAEIACEKIRKEIEADAREEEPVASFTRFVDEKKGEDLVALLNEVWFGIPESIGAHSLPGFNALCDLCSESHCINESGFTYDD